MLMIGLPMSGRLHPPEFSISLRLLDFPYNMNTVWNVVKGKPVDEAREEIAQDAIDSKCKFLFFLDDDVICPSYTVRRLFNALAQRIPPLNNYAIAAGIYCRKSNPPEPLVYQGDGVGAFWDWKRGQLFDCERIGTGCMLIHVPELLKIPKPWFKTSNPSPEELPENYIGSMVSDDMHFCKQVRDAGYKILADGGTLPAHYNHNDQKFYTLPPSSHPLEEKREA